MSCAELDTFTFARHVLDEADLKAIVLEELRRRGAGWNDAVVANEYRLGTTSVRADLAVFGDEFVGIEIKSERDSLKRLANQVSAYARYFDRVIVVVADKHLRQLDWKTLRKADVWRVSESGKISVAADRSELPETSSLSDLLTAAQRDQYQLTTDTSELKAAVAFAAEFRKRFGETSDQFWRSLGSRKISAADVSLLSRFRSTRLLAAEHQEAQRREWEAWEAQAAFVFGESVRLSKS